MVPVSLLLDRCNVIGSPGSYFLSIVTSKKETPLSENDIMGPIAAECGIVIATCLSIRPPSPLSLVCFLPLINVSVVLSMKTQDSSPIDHAPRD